MPESPPAGLRRSLTLGLLTLYGLDTTIGAGIYVLIGEVAGSAGRYAPLAFVCAAVVAGMNALVFAELAGRYPRAAGEAYYVRVGLRSAPVAVAVGGLVTLAGLVSAATVVRGTTGYAAAMVSLPTWLMVTVVTLGLGALAGWGIRQAALAAAALTLVEIGGLLTIVWGGRDLLFGMPVGLVEIVAPLERDLWIGIGAGAVVAFYAFIGFEDMVNVAEEVRDVERTLPRAIGLTFLVTLVLYVLVALVAVRAVAPAELAASEAPIALVFARTGGAASQAIVLVAILAALNGALIQIVKSARVLYGMSALGWLPKPLARVHSRLRTPLLAGAIVTVLVLALALTFPLLALAQLTALMVLVIFALVSAALIALKQRPDGTHARLDLPLWVPILALALDLGLVAVQVRNYVA